MQIVFDFDFLLYEAACVAEKRSISAYHKPTDETFILNTRTELWGRKKTKNEGLVAEKNKEARSEVYKAEDFIITDIQTPLSKSMARRKVDKRIENVCERLQCWDYSGYSGSGDSFRLGLSTLLKYKGNRDNNVRPYHLNMLKEYLVEEHNCKIVTGLEADDHVAIIGHEGMKAWNKSKKDSDKVITVAVDKDNKGTSCWLFNPNKDFEPYLCDGFGALWLEGKEIEGKGRLFKYFQILGQDDADNYKANCFSDVKWGVMSAYKALVLCKNDQEAWQVLVNSFKYLYPERKKITGWRGDEFEIDWLYVLQEMADMAHMKRWYDDRIIVADVLERLGIRY